MSWLPKGGVQASNKLLTVAAPIGGLNVANSMADMPPTDAITMRNWWPQSYGCTVRKGSQKWTTYLGGSVDTIAKWSSITGAQKIFAFANNNLFDISARGVAGTPILTGLSNTWWQQTQVVNGAGSHLIMVDGIDDGIIYDETGLHRLVVGTTPADYTWVGLDPKDCIEVTSHQSRLWAVKNNTSEAYYLPVSEVWGTFTLYDFGPLFTKGGYLAQLTTWTIDDGNGAEDHLVAVSSQGEAAVFGGTDPSDIATWQLVGVYNVGAPLPGRRAYSKVSGDLVFLTQRGLVSTAAMLVSTKVKDSVTIKTSKIQFLLSEETNLKSNLANWCVDYFPNYNMIMVNIPGANGEGATQLVANDVLETQPWSIFTDWNAICWKLVGTTLLYGDSTGTVYEAWIGHQDFVELDGTGGTYIDSEVQQAYSYLGEAGTQKQIDLYRPNFIMTDKGGIATSTAIDYDFIIKDPSPAGNPSNISTRVFSKWDIALWDADVWSGASLFTQNTWVQARGLGFVASLSMAARSNTSVTWISTDFSCKHGGLL